MPQGTGLVRTSGGAFASTWLGGMSDFVGRRFFGRGIGAAAGLGVAADAVTLLQALQSQIEKLRGDSGTGNADIAEIKRQVATQEDGTLARAVTDAAGKIDPAQEWDGKGNTLGDYWTNAGVGGRMLEGLGLRVAKNPHVFSDDFGGMPVGQNALDFEGLDLLRPANKLDGESDLEFCRRVAPVNANGPGGVSTVVWFDDQTVPGYTYGEVILNAGPNGPDYVVVVYAPNGSPSLEDIRKLFEFTPDSGPPAVDGCKELCALMSQVPVAWSHQ